MRIAQMITQTVGGPVDHAVSVAVELARRGHDSHIVGPAGAYATAAVREGVGVHTVDVRTKTDVVGAARMASAVRRVRPDLVHLQDRRAGLVGRTVAVPASVPAVYTLHGVPDRLAALVPGNLDFARARVLDKVAYLRGERLLAHGPRSAVITPCEALAEYAREAIGISAELVHTVPNGVGGRWLDPAPRAGRGARVTAAWVGVMAPVKRVPALVRAAARVPELDLVLVGDGPDRGRIEAAVREAGSQDRVRFAGHLEDPSPELHRADLFVLPSAAEACPMALLQAMACSLPVVASGVGGVPEIVRPRVEGLLVPPAGEDRWVAALAALAADAGLRRSMGAAARDRVVTRFTVDRNVDALLDVYEGVSR